MNLEREISMDKLYITDLFDVKILQRLQNSFSSALEISVGISDENGEELTQHVSQCVLCKECIKKSEEGIKRCRICDKKAMELSAKSGKPELYTCHAGLKNFAVPIMTRGHYLGCFFGGQVLFEPLPEDEVRAYAEELNISPEEYVQAAREITILSEDKLKSIADCLYDMTDLLVQMSYKQYKTLQMNTMMEKEAHMKSDFLANMSHEIRTPMNAVIGMAEIAMREQLTPVAREYIKQIKASGTTLLTIINDILDFSKIESGKLNINMAEYKPFSIVQDIASVIMTRIGDKKIEFIVDVAPDIPSQLMGDSIRIRQIIINLSNNAVKFTKEGYVHLSIAYEKKSDREIMLQVYVEDTGIGIKEEDMDKLFQSFQQLDSKRNRNVEGTGLGLAISKQLITLMNGRIWVESEYEKGSRFSFEIPQLVIDDKPSIEIEKKPRKTVGLFCTNPYMKTHMQNMLKQLNVECLLVEGREDLKQLEEKNVEFFFFELTDNVYASIMNNYLASHPALTGVMLTGFGEKIKPYQENVIAVSKPVYIMNLDKILSHEDLYAENDVWEGNFEFVAPDAEILIVDDNEPNLMVAEGLLAPLQMKIEKATSGRQCLEMIGEKHYDLIFMDHMMPELDGIETTRIIRSFHEEYDDVPIIALTANVMEETQVMFLVEGMNDFVAKPIELRVIISKLRQWLPTNKIKKVEVTGEKEKEKKESLERLAKKIVIPKLDVKMALQLAGSETLFWKILQEYAKTISKKVNLIQEHMNEKNWKKYTIEVHALKSFSRQIGALELSELAAQMEQAGNHNDIDFIYANHEKMLKEYQSYEPILRECLRNQINTIKAKDSYDSERVQSLLDSMLEAMDNLDADTMDHVVEELDSFMLPPEQEAYFMQMKDAVEGLDTEACETVVVKWKELLAANNR